MEKEISKEKKETKQCNDNVAENCKTEKTNNTKTNLSYTDLIALEKMSTLLCQKYERIAKRYDGTFDSDEKSYCMFEKHYKIHDHILNLMENVLCKLFNDVQKN